MRANRILAEIAIVGFVMLLLAGADWFDHKSHDVATHTAAAGIPALGTAAGEGVLDIFRLAVDRS